MAKKELDRREFIKKTSQVAAAAAVFSSGAASGKVAANKETNLTAKLPMRVLGKTGLELPILGYGGAALPKRWGNPLSTDDRIKLVRYAFDRGVRYFDTAGNYMVSERIMGAGLKDIRNSVCLVTKVETTDAKKVRKAVERSLQELQTDYLDVIQIHGTPGLEQMSVRQAMKVHAGLVKLRDEGMARFIGFSAHSYFDKALALISSGGFDLCMLSYGYIPRGYNQVFSARMTELRNSCVAKAHESDMGIVAMKVMGAGMFGAWSSQLAPGFDRQRLRRLPAAAISYLLQDKRVHLLNIGMRLPEEVDANIETITADPAYTLESQALLAEFSALALASDAARALRVD
jgi:predicted aldo/keto reductase-like oxidoreductase